MAHLQIEGTQSIEQLLTHVVSSYLVQLYCICVVWSAIDAEQIGSINVNAWGKQNERNENVGSVLIWLKYNKTADKQANIDDLMEMGLNQGCQAFIVGSHSAMDFLDSYEAVRFTGGVNENHYESPYVVVLPAKDDVPNHNVQSILKHPAVEDIPNIVIINPSKSPSNFDLITSQFVGRNSKFYMNTLDTFNGLSGKFVKNADLFPNKFVNLEQRIVRLAMFNYKPYSVWEEVLPGTGNSNSFKTNQENDLLVDGTESMMFLQYCRQYNCTIAVTYDDEGEWGAINENMTGGGVLGGVVERRADVGISALYSWYHEYRFLDFSVALSRTGITCLAPKPLLLGGWLLPALPFGQTMWIAVFVSFISLVLAVFATRIVAQRTKETFTHTSTTEFSHVTLQVFGTFVVQSTHVLPQSLPEMVVIGFALLVNFLIANAYSGGLSAIMTAPRFNSPIDTVQQLAATGMGWGATGMAWVYSILEAPEPALQKLVSAFHVMSTEELHEKALTQQFAFSVERLPFGHYAVGEYIDENVLRHYQLMLDDIYFEYCVAMSYKTWPFKRSFDLFALRVLESGIQRFWELQTIIKHDNSKIQLGIAISRQKEATELVSLTLGHFSGIFILWIIGITMSIVSFIIERFYHNLKETN